jgi:hypothetical protein
MFDKQAFVRNRTTAADSRHSSSSKDLRLLRLRPQHTNTCTNLLFRPNSKGNP